MGGRQNVDCFMLSHVRRQRGKASKLEGMRMEGPTGTEMITLIIAISSIKGQGLLIPKLALYTMFHLSIIMGLGCSRVGRVLA